jgi:hypothetical protein
MIKRFLMFLLLVVNYMGYSQVISLGSGTAINSITTASPINIYYRRQVSQTVYTVAELNTAGVAGPNTINQLGYFITNIPVYDIPGYTIQIKHTNAADASGNLNGGYTTVKNSFNYAPSQGNWDMIALDNPFLWNGVQNIVVRICWSQVQPTYNPSGQLRVYDATGGYKYRLDDNGGSICGSNPNSTLNIKPQIRFIFESETVWTGAASTDWFNNSNWSANIPDGTIDARIPVGTANNPTLVGTANCLNLILEGSMILDEGGSINVNADFINTGTYTDNGGNTVLTGVGPNIVNNAGALTISNLIFDSNNGGIITGSNIRVSEELQVNKTTLTTNDLLTINSDETGTARISELITDCFYILNMQDAWGDGWNGGTLTVIEDGEEIGTYQAYAASTSVVLSLANGANIELSYSAGNYEGENTYQLIDPNGNTVFNVGPTPATGIVFSTVPSCGFTPPITGGIAMETYIDAGQTYWRYFSSAVQGATVGGYQDDFTTAGFAGSLFPNFGWVSMYTYDETLPAGLGYLPIVSAAQVLLPGQGLNVWSGDTINGTQPFTIDLVGVPNQGDINMPVSFTNTGTEAEDGWNLVGNPYPSTIDWDSPSWTKTNMASATYILNPDNQQYATYVNGASVNGGSRYIASQQAFWVYATSPIPSLIAKEGVKSSVDQAFVKSSGISSGMKISINGFGLSDECVMRHVDNAVDEYEAEYDAYKMYGGWGIYPNVSLINSSQQELSVHSFDKQYQEWSIPVKVIVFEDGFYDIVFNDMSEIDVPCLKLEDTYNGQIYDVYEGQPISVELYDTTFAPRFILHIGNNYEVISNSVTCNGNSDGALEVYLNQSYDVDYEIITPSGTLTGSSYGNPLLIENLKFGTHTVTIPQLQNLCASNDFTIVISSPLPISVIDVIENTNIGNDGSILLNVNGGTPPYTFDWSNENNSIDNINLNEGSYSVTITDSHGCIWTNDFSVGNSLGLIETLDESNTLFVSYLQQSNEIIIDGINLVENSKVYIYSVNGDLIESYQVSPYTNSVHKLKRKLAKGMYIVHINAETLKFIY